MAKVTDNTWIVDDDGAPVLLSAGDDVPAWAREQVGDHLFEDGDGEAEADYGDQKVADLRKEIDRRNADRSDEDRISPDGTAKADLVAALEADDAKQQSE